MSDWPKELMLDLFGSLVIHGGWVVGVYRKFILWNLLEIKKNMHTLIYHQPSRWILRDSNRKLFFGT